MQIQRNDELRYIDIWLRTEEPTLTLPISVSDSRTMTSSCGTRGTETSLS